MTCDSAILIQPQNEFQAFKNVKIVQADTTIITGNQLDYNGESRTFTISKNVELRTPSSLLNTKQLFYDRKSATAYYTTRSTLTRKSLELTSDRGSYNTDYETVWLRGKVEAIDSAYTLLPILSCTTPTSIAMSLQVLLLCSGTVPESCACIRG